MNFKVDLGQIDKYMFKLKILETNKTISDAQFKQLVLKED